MWHACSPTGMYKIFDLERAQVMIKDENHEPIVDIIAYGSTRTEAMARAEKQAEILCLAEGLRFREVPRFNDEAEAKVRAEKTLIETAAV